MFPLSNKIKGNYTKTIVSLITIIFSSIPNKINAQSQDKLSLGSNIFAEISVGTIISNQMRGLYYEHYPFSIERVWDNPSLMISANIGNRSHFKISSKTSFGFQFNWINGGIYLFAGNYLATKNGTAKLSQQAYKNYDGHRSIYVKNVYI